jgi:hypothetical protein
LRFGLHNTPTVAFVIPSSTAGGIQISEGIKDEDPCATRFGNLLASRVSSWRILRVFATSQWWSELAALNQTHHEEVTPRVEYNENLTWVVSCGYPAHQSLAILVRCEEMWEANADVVFL